MTREARKHSGYPRDYKNRPYGWSEIVHEYAQKQGGEEVERRVRNPDPIQLLVKVHGLLAVEKWSEEERKQKLQQLLETLEQPGVLSEREVIIIKARFIHGHTYAEISVQMESMDKGTIARYIQGGIDKLSWELAVLKDHQSFRELFFEAVGSNSLNWPADEVLNAINKIQSHMSEFSENERLLLEYRYGLSGTILPYHQIEEMFNVSMGTLGAARSRSLFEKVRRILG